MSNGGRVFWSAFEDQSSLNDVPRHGDWAKLMSLQDRNDKLQDLTSDQVDGEINTNGPYSDCDEVYKSSGA